MIVKHSLERGHLEKDWKRHVLFFRNILPVILAFLTLQDKHNTGTLKVKIKFIYTKFMNKQEKLTRKA